MFHHSIWTGVIESDEGFTVKLLSRNYLRYTEGELCYEAFYEEAIGSASLSASLDDCRTALTVALPPEERDRVLRNIVRALESRGLRVTLL